MTSAFGAQWQRLKKSCKLSSVKYINFIIGLRV